MSSSLLDQNSPNPFNPRTVIRYRLPAGGAAQLAVYDVNGRLVRTLVKGYQSAGEAAVTWLGDDDAGKAVASGVYFYRLEAAGRCESRKMVMIR